jgi:predicted GNAT superfamily acetyltransferase
VDLQREVWGSDWSDIVPASLLQVAAYVGGIVIGAFSDSGDLAGFVFGLSGFKNGEAVHWSHLLGVRPELRNAGVGRLLKEAQRVELAKRNIRRMSWTFDPLVAKNAHFNLNRLGAAVVDYVPDMYGTTSSPLHYGIATDRLVVSVDTSGESQSRQPAPSDGAPVLSLNGSARDALEGTTPPSLLRIEVPEDIKKVIDQSPRGAAQWREAVRQNFQWALKNGFSVCGFDRDAVTEQCYYVLERRAS